MNNLMLGIIALAAITAFFCLLSAIDASHNYYKKKKLQKKFKEGTWKHNYPTR